MPASRLYAALGLCCLFVISLTSYVLWRSHFEEYNRAKTFTQNLVHATSLSLAAELRQIDLVLQTIADEASHEYQTGKLDPRFLTQTMNRQNGRLHA
jgi:hypothetical protein